MKKNLVLGLLLFAMATLSAFAQDKPDTLLVRFNGAIGVTPVSNVVVTDNTTTVTPNAVRGISPSGQIWRISDLHARVTTDGHIHVRGLGLLLGGGNNIGTNANATVFATLCCPASSSSTSLTGVALDPHGNFTIDDVLSPLPQTTCDSAVLLIRTTGGTQPWFAAGIKR